MIPFNGDEKLARLAPLWLIKRKGDRIRRCLFRSIPHFHPRACGPYDSYWAWAADVQDVRVVGSLMVIGIVKMENGNNVPVMVFTSNGQPDGTALTDFRALVIEFLRELFGPEREAIENEDGDDVYLWEPSDFRDGFCDWLLARGLTVEGLGFSARLSLLSDK